MKATRQICGSSLHDSVLHFIVSSVCKSTSFRDPLWFGCVVYCHLSKLFAWFYLYVPSYCRHTVNLYDPVQFWITSCCVDFRFRDDVVIGHCLSFALHPWLPSQLLVSLAVIALCVMEARLFVLASSCCLDSLCSCLSLLFKLDLAPPALNPLASLCFGGPRFVPLAIYESRFAHYL